MAIPSTGFRGAARLNIRTIVDSLGAVYSGDLHKEHTTHLVTATDAQLNALDEAAKISYAREWGIPIVQYDWLLDSAACGHLLDTQPYLAAQVRCTASMQRPSLPKHTASLTWHMDHKLQGAKTGEGSSDGDWSVEKLRGCPIPPQDQLLTQGGTYSLSAAVLVCPPVSSSRAVCACR